MNMNATEEQTKPTIVNFNDGSLAKVWSDGRWDLTLPSGKHVRGQESFAAAATKVVRDAHDKFVLATWERGSFLSLPGKPQHFACPLD